MWLVELGRLRVRGDFLLLPLLMFLFSPPVVPAAVFAAALLHEMGHLSVMACFGVRCRELRLTAWGAEIDAPKLCLLSYGRELCVTLAGAAGNIAAAFVLSGCALRLGWEEGYLFAGAQLLLGLFNLLPVQPLDGGRALYLLCAWLGGPYLADMICVLTGVVVGTLIMAAGVYISLLRRSGALFVLSAFALFLSALRQLGLAKGAPRV